MVAFKIKGIAETINNLDLTERKVSSGANNILREGGTVIKRVIEVKTPYGPGKNGGHAKDHVKLGGVGTSAGIGAKSIKIGYDSNVAWRMYFLEKGTYSKGNPKGIKPRNIVANSLEVAEPMVNEVMAQALSELLGGL